MGRFLLIWIFLAFSLFVTTLAVSIVGFRHLDLRYVTFVQLLVIPTFQAAVVTWVGGHWGLSRLKSAVLETMRHRLVAGFIVLDTGLLCLGVMLRGRPIVGVVGQIVVDPRWAAIKVLIAGGLLLAAAFRLRDSLGRSSWILGLASLVMAVAVDPFLPWLDELSGLVHGVGPLVIRWLVLYGGLATVFLVVLFEVATNVRKYAPLPAFYFDLAGGCVFVVVLVYALNIFLRPFLVEPWLSTVIVFASIGSTALLVGSWLVFACLGNDPRELRRTE